MLSWIAAMVFTQPRPKADIGSNCFASTVATTCSRWALRLDQPCDHPAQYFGTAVGGVVDQPCGLEVETLLDRAPWSELRSLRRFAVWRRLVGDDDPGLDIVFQNLRRLSNGVVQLMTHHFEAPTYPTTSGAAIYTMFQDGRN